MSSYKLLDNRTVSGRSNRGTISSVDVRKREQSFKDYEQILGDHKSNFEERWKGNVKASSNSHEFDQLERIRTLGIGAFGRVMLVRHKQDSVYYAMKILDKKKLVRMKQVDHTYNEKHILQSMRFPFVVFLELCFKDSSYIYMVLPFINGGEMFTHLRRLGKFEENLSRFYAAQVTLALEYLHRCNLVYRDLKPENILIDCEGYIRITDFGFSKLISNRKGSEESRTTVRTWTLCGTPEYLAPEIILSKGYNKSVDWWSFGVLIYELNAGYSPFYAKEPVKMYDRITSAKYRFPSFFSEDLRDIVRQLLQVDLSRRFGNLKAGPLDIKKHRWFQTIDWIKIYNKAVVPSFVPVCSSPGDDSNFEKYGEEDLIVADTDPYAKEFENF